MNNTYSAVVIGCGFYGAYMASHLAAMGHSVLACDARNRIMERASYNNQARVHNGYHYPRSILTAQRSRINFPRFVAEFESAIEKAFTKIYAIGRNFSEVSAAQFQRFMRVIGAPIRALPASHRALFDSTYVEDAFCVQEFAFDADRLRIEMEGRLHRNGVEVRLGCDVLAIEPGSNGGIDLDALDCGNRIKIKADLILNCTYSETNRILRASHMPLIPLKHEMAELCLIDVPDELRSIGVTVMCGPFFSCMPFPPKQLHSLSHVSYTPRFHWNEADVERVDEYDPRSLLRNAGTASAFTRMRLDAARYVPSIRNARYRESMWEIKTVLPRSEVDDSRPILFKDHWGFRNHHVVVGSKIDNVFDACERLESVLG